MNFYQEVQVEMEISEKIFHFVILFFTPKTTATKTLKSYLTIKLNLSFLFNLYIIYFLLVKI